MRLRIVDDVELDPCAPAAEPVGHEDVMARVRRFAQLRAAQRALDPSTREPQQLADLDALRRIRELLGALVRRVDPDRDPAEPGDGEPPLHDALAQVDGALDGYAQVVLSLAEKIPLSQLRASLSRDGLQRDTEVMALLEVCLASEPTPRRHLRLVDFLVTFLCADRRDGEWFVKLDPPNLNDTIRMRSWQAGQCEAALEARIAGQFQRAAERLTDEVDGAAVLDEISTFKAEIAPFFFVPSVLRCIVGYNVLARNHFEDRLQRHRELDAAIDDELGLFAASGGDKTTPSALPAHEAPGVLAVQEAIRRRLLEADGGAGPAERIAAALDLGWLEEDEREALCEPGRDGIQRVIRMTVVLGHLAMAIDDHAQDLRALGLHATQLDTWICALGDEVQREIDTLIRENAYDGAVRLGDTKSRFLAAVLVVARRRLNPDRRRGGAGDDDPSAARREAIALVREYLERHQLHRSAPLFLDLLGGGWRRTAALAAVGLLLASVGLIRLTPAEEPRAIDELSASQAREISGLLVSAYRDHADAGSMFVGTLSDAWDELPPAKQRERAELIRARVAQRGVEEVLLLDSGRVLRAHYLDGAWRTPRGWERERARAPAASRD